MKKLLALLLALAMVLSLGMTTAFAEGDDTPLVVATSALSQKFSPFFADTAYDQDVAGLTQIGMMTTDRVGGIVYNGIEGEVHSYNGTDYTYYGTGDLAVNYDEDVEGRAIADQVIRGGLSVQKVDARTGKAEPEGAASFEGAEFTIYNRGQHAVRRPDALRT